MKTRFIWLISLTVIVAFSWIVIWYVLSSQAEKAFSRGVGKAASLGHEVSCQNRNHKGFPFRFTVQCDDFSYKNEQNIKFAFSGLHAEAYVYRPQHQVVNFTSPAELQLGELGRFQLNWQKGRLGSQLQTNGLTAATMKLEEARLTLVDGPEELKDLALSAGKLLLTARRSEKEEAENSLVFGVLSEELAVLSDRFNLPAFSLSSSILLYDVADVFEGRGKLLPLWIKRGGEMDLHGLTFVSGKAYLSLKGWVKLDLNGFLNADLSVDVADFEDFTQKMGPELVQFQSILTGLYSAIQGLGEEVTLEGKSVKRVRISIRKGFVSVGLVPFGTIPQIDLSNLD